MSSHPFRNRRQGKLCRPTFRERGTPTAVGLRGSQSKVWMSDRETILFAHGDSARLELIREGGWLFLLRNGDQLPAAQWAEDDVRRATEAFHRRMKEEGL